MMNPQIPEDKEARKKCCEQSFLASVVGLSRDERKPAGPWRRRLGLLLLAGVHLHLLAWSALVSLVRPRYRPVARFQLRYFRDVMARELRSQR